MKTHAITGATLGFKNLKGLISDTDKVDFHNHNLIEHIVALNALIKPDITILDGTIGMEGNGPVYGDPANLGILMASNDPSVAEIAGLLIMGFDPFDLEYIQYALSVGLIDRDKADLSDVNVYGKELNAIVRPVKKTHLPDFQKYGIQLISDNACSACLSQIIIHFSDPLLLRLYRNTTIVAGKCDTADLPIANRNRLLIWGSCCDYAPNEGKHFAGCPPDFLDSGLKLYEPLNKLRSSTQRR